MSWIIQLLTEVAKRGSPNIKDVDTMVVCSTENESGALILQESEVAYIISDGLLKIFAVLNRRTKDQMLSNLQCCDGCDTAKHNIVMHELVLLDYAVEIRKCAFGVKLASSSSRTDESTTGVSDYQIVLVLKEVDCLRPHTTNDKRFANSRLAKLAWYYEENECIGLIQRILSDKSFQLNQPSQCNEMPFRKPPMWQDSKNHTASIGTSLIKGLRHNHAGVVDVTNREIITTEAIIDKNYSNDQSWKMGTAKAQFCNYEQELPRFLHPAHYALNSNGCYGITELQDWSFHPRNRQQSSPVRASDLSEKGKSATPQQNLLSLKRVSCRSPPQSPVSKHIVADSAKTGTNPTQIPRNKESETCDQTNPQGPTSKPSILVTSNHAVADAPKTCTNQDQKPGKRKSAACDQNNPHESTSAPPRITESQLNSDQNLNLSLNRTFNTPFTLPNSVFRFERARISNNRKRGGQNFYTYKPKMQHQDKILAFLHQSWTNSNIPKPNIGNNAMVCHGAELRNELQIDAIKTALMETQKAIPLLSSKMQRTTKSMCTNLRLSAESSPNLLPDTVPSGSLPSTRDIQNRRGFSDTELNPHLMAITLKNFKREK